MQRVLVIGSPGSGKSTFAHALGAAAGLPVVHIDQMFWHPGWVMAPADEYLARLDAEVARESWIIDGNYADTFDRRIPRADTIIWLRRSTLSCCWRVLKRVWSSHGRVRRDMAPGCPEQLDWEFMTYVWRFDRDYGPRITAALDRNGAWSRTIVLRSDRESAGYLQRVAEAR